GRDYSVPMQVCLPEHDLRMDDRGKGHLKAEEKQKGVPTVSALFADADIIELVYRAEPPQTLLALFSGGRWALQRHIDRLGLRLVPFSPKNNLIKNSVVLLPSEPRTYGTEEELVSEIQGFIHRYVDLSPTFGKVATYYVILTWLYDAFNELPYLRLRGDYGSGKTRALLTIGSLCYKGFFASGASTVSPLFHTLDAFRGTLIFDYADFRFTYNPTALLK